MKKVTLRKIALRRKRIFKKKVILMVEFLYVNSGMILQMLWWYQKKLKMRYG